MENIYLPDTVEEMLKNICSKQLLPPPEPRARKELALIGEEAALDLLRTIKASKEIRTLTGYIIYMVKNKKNADTAASNASVLFSSPKRNGYTATTSSPAPRTPSRQDSMQSEMSRRLDFGRHMVALGELEFRKQFLILNYIGNAMLEDVISIEKIQSLKNLSMNLFESEVWKDVGCDFISEEDRIKNVDCDLRKTHVYRCIVDQDGNFTFKGPYLQKARTHLQRVLGDENVLDVRFAEQVVDGNRSMLDSKNYNPVYYKIAKEGILVGLRRYHFFVFKDGGKEEKKKNPNSSPVKCYFVCTESSAALDENKPYILFGKRIHEARSMFMHIHTVSSLAKYMARFSLILSKTIKLEVDLSSVNIQRIDDIPCMSEDECIICSEDGEPLIHTDGTGFISDDLASKCPMNIFKGNCLIPGDIEKILEQVEYGEKPSTLINCKSLIGDPPLLIQFRLFYNGCAVKGTLLVNKRLPPRTIQIRPSMVKVETDPEFSITQAVNSLEIVGTSNRPKRAFLSRHLIALLKYGGVPQDFFMELLSDALHDVQNVQFNKRAALEVSLNYGDMDDFLLSRMILCGLPLDEPYLQYRLSVLVKEERKRLKGGRLPVTECYNLMGTADPTRTLRTNEVCVILDNGQISGKVLVYKHPGLHFGDIHVLTATYVKDLENIVGNAKYAIFFPTKGKRSLADEIANSDFDGDMYWVSRNPQLLEFFKPSKPWEWISPKRAVSQHKPTQFSTEELEKELFHLFMVNRFTPSNTIGAAADSWLVFMDRLLTLGDECAYEKQCLHQKMLQLVDLYYHALDAPKKGMKVEIPKDLKAEKFPHFMERTNFYCSKSILGLIYDQVISFETQDLPKKEMWELPCFSGQVPHDCLKLWKGHYNHYKSDMSKAMSSPDKESKDKSANQVIQKYKQILYGAADFEQSLRNRDAIFNEAVAIYQVSYNYAKSAGVEKCSFAWRVAGRALCELHAMKQGEGTIICSPCVLREIMIK